ncbi:MAG: crotonase/enoyl-CoA hydratase family protein, partial [SAR324 cluster bacterium]|nr:crotonase/enoyl-CoA hydratase family protein [SAR324 cluster bacterium]
MTESLKIEIEGPIAQVILNRPEKANALDRELWQALGKCFRDLDQNKSVRVCILSAEGKHFTAGIDLNLLQEIGIKSEEYDCEGRKRDFLRRKILELQSSFSEFERCRKPVIAAVHGSCIGGGVDLITACDLRYATEDARFQIKEVDLGLVADVGTLQRLPTLIPQGIVRELAFTGRSFDGKEALSMGLLNNCYENKESLMQGVLEVARSIAAKSPLAISGIKETLLYSRDHTVQES